jgi:hypothetical protein
MHVARGGADGVEEAGVLGAGRRARRFDVPFDFGRGACA